MDFLRKKVPIFNQKGEVKPTNSGQWQTCFDLVTGLIERTQHGMLHTTGIKLQLSYNNLGGFKHVKKSLFRQNVP